MSDTQPTSTAVSRVTRLLIEAMAKHLPPSAAGLRLVDIDGFSSAVLLNQRPDLDITPASLEELAALRPGAFDAVVSFDIPLNQPFLGDALSLLRPGGRLITIDSERNPDQAAVQTLEGSGYTRILVETGAECPLPVGTLARGEKPHTTDDTLERVRVASDLDPSRRTLADFSGRYIHLLVQQTPNLPVWKLQPGQQIEWRAVTLLTATGAKLLAFSSLPAAVAFMQEAVLKGIIRDVNKVGKFKREVALTWELPVLINPTLDGLTAGSIIAVPVDPAAAEHPDE